MGERGREKEGEREYLTCQPFQCRMTLGACARQQELAQKAILLLAQGVRCLSMGIELERAIRCQGCPMRKERGNAAGGDAGEAELRCDALFDFDALAEVRRQLREELEELDRVYGDECSPPPTYEELEERRVRHRDAVRAWRARARAEE